jgi:hypothetical protein
MKTYGISPLASPQPDSDRPGVITTGQQGEMGRDAFKEVDIIPFRDARVSGFEASRSPVLGPSSLASAFANAGSVADLAPFVIPRFTPGFCD